ncbi:MAG: hypothetical protein IPM29_16260 [Planctomycetes bacterium]|nr:hypothetical protein [Planctomycetota bacterium]
MTATPARRPPRCASTPRRSARSCRGGRSPCCRCRRSRRAPRTAPGSRPGARRSPRSARSPACRPPASPRSRPAPHPTSTTTPPTPPRRAPRRATACATASASCCAAGRSPSWTRSASCSAGCCHRTCSEVAGSANPHWVGNLNVFLGGKAVERHLARSLRVHAGRANLALFTLGDGADAYRFELAGDAADWSVSLSRAPRLLGRRHGAGDGALPTDTWHDFQGTSTVYLCLQPPAGAERGALEVHVQQRSTGRTAVVEFDLDPGAQGPGCYAL